MKMITALFFMALMLINPVWAKSIAVTDLAYSETIAQYIRSVDYHQSSRQVESLSDSYSSSHGIFSANDKIDYHDVQQNFSYIEFGELRKFTGDIKGALINAGQFSVVEAKPARTKKEDSVYNLIARIKKGDFPHADYVLFGRLSDMSFNNSTYQVDDSMTNVMFSLTLTAEFSLINTKNYQVIASFSATGEGQDSKVLSLGSSATPNRGAVVLQVSKSLGQDVFRQIEEQVFDQVSGEPIQNPNVGSRQNDVIEPPPQKPKGVTTFE